MATMSSDRYLVAFTSAGYAFRTRHDGTPLGALRAAKRLLTANRSLARVEVQEHSAARGGHIITATVTA